MFSYVAEDCQSLEVSACNFVTNLSHFRRKGGLAVAEMCLKKTLRKDLSVAIPYSRPSLRVKKKKSIRFLRPHKMSRKQIPERHLCDETVS